jgi:hypothetical protein
MPPIQGKNGNSISTSPGVVPRQSMRGWRIDPSSRAKLRAIWKVSAWRHGARRR